MSESNQLKKEIEKFKRFFEQAYSEKIEKAPKTEIAVALWKYLKPKYQRYKEEYLTEEEKKKFNELMKKGIVAKEGNEYLIPLSDRGQGISKVKQGKIIGKNWVAKRSQEEFGYNSFNNTLKELLEKREADCISFTHLFMKIGKEVGLKVKPIKMNPHHVVPEVQFNKRKILFDPILRKITPTNKKIKYPIYLKEKDLIKSEKAERQWKKQATRRRK